MESVVAVGWVMNASWGPITNPGALQTNYWRIPFTGAPHILGSAFLSEVSIGTHDGVAGVAVATFKRFEFLNDKGSIQEVEQTEVSSWIEVERCVSITVALDLIAATGCGGWSFVWLE
jgi:hypothetical protein